MRCLGIRDVAQPSIQYHLPPGVPRHPQHRHLQEAQPDEPSLAWGVGQEEHRDEATEERTATGEDLLADRPDIHHMSFFKEYPHDIRNIWQGSQSKLISYVSDIALFY